MRKLISMVITALVVLSVNVSAGTLLNDDVIFGITEIGVPVIDENGDSTNLRHQKHNNYNTLKAEFIDISDMERLIELMSDENLEIEKPIEGYEELEAAWENKEGVLVFDDEKGGFWEYYFDESCVVIDYSPDIYNSEKIEIYAGIFRYKKDIYEELSSVFEKAYDDAYKRTEEAQMLNYLELEDFNILYSADSGHTLMNGEAFEWGICTYNYKGEKKTAVYGVITNGHGRKMCHMTEKVGADNHILFDSTGVLNIYSDGKVFINQQIKISVPLYSMKISVSEDMKLKSVEVTMRGEETPEILTTDQFQETGTIPEGFFSVNKEKDENEEKEEPKEENKDDNVKEDVTDKIDGSEYEDEELEEDELDEKDTQNSENVNEKEDAQDIQPSLEVQIRKRAEESGLVLTIGEKDALVRGVKAENDVPPVIRNSRTMLPARFVGEGLGATVEWNGEKREVTVRKGDIVIRIYIDSDKAYVNNKEEKLDSPAFIENDRTYIPLRFIAENFGADVIWDSEERMVFIAEKELEK